MNAEENSDNVVRQKKLMFWKEMNSSLQVISWQLQTCDGLYRQWNRNVYLQCWLWSVASN
jgi:hypothetical protein